MLQQLSQPDIQAQYLHFRQLHPNLVGEKYICKYFRWMLANIDHLEGGQNSGLIQIYRLYTTKPFKNKAYSQYLDQLFEQSLGETDLSRSSWQYQQKFQEQHPTNYLSSYFQSQLQLFEREEQTLDPELDHEINNIIAEMANGNIQFEDTQSYGESQLFYRNHSIPFTYNNRPKIYGLTPNQIKNQKMVREYICAIANQGGGIIVGGTDSNQINILGCQFEAQDDNHMDVMLQKIQTQIFPSVQLIHDYVPVYESYLHPKSGHTLVCPRIKVKVMSSKNVHYLRNKNKGFHDIFNIFVQTKSSITHKYTEILQEQIYNLIQVKFRDGKANSIEWQPHKPKLAQPFPIQSNIELKWSKNKQAPLQSWYHERQQEQPKFQYSHNSLIIVASENKAKFIDKLKNSLIDEKKIFTLKRPFEKYLMKGCRVVWFFSYQDKSERMRNFISKYDKGKNLTFIPVTKIIRFPTKRLSEARRENLIQGFKNIYPEVQLNFEEGFYLGKDQSQIKCFYLSFNDLAPAVFAFCYLQTLSIKPYFIKQKDVLKQPLLNHAKGHGGVNQKWADI